MDQRSDHIRQDIESTRASLDEKLDTLEAKARETFDVKHQVAERPWLALGTAVAAGYIIGSLGGGEEEQRWSGRPMTTTNYNQHAAWSDDKQYAVNDTHRTGRSSSDSFLSQFDDEIDMLKMAAVSTLTNFLRDTLKEYLPALGQQLDQTARQRGKTPSGAPGASRYYDERPSAATNTEAIPATTNYGSNLVDQAAVHASPYYPPGAADASADRERSVGEDTTRY